MDQLAADLASLIDALKFERAVVAGFSLGGTIAMRLAIDHPDKVAGQVLVPPRAVWAGSAAVFLADGCRA